jgi:hypothetical protein
VTSPAPVETVWPTSARPLAAVISNIVDDDGDRRPTNVTVPPAPRTAAWNTSSLARSPRSSGSRSLTVSRYLACSARRQRESSGRGVANAKQ